MDSTPGPELQSFQVTQSTSPPPGCCTLCLGASPPPPPPPPPPFLSPPPPPPPPLPTDLTQVSVFHSLPGPSHIAVTLTCRDAAMNPLEMRGAKQPVLLPGGAIRPCNMTCRIPGPSGRRP